MATELQYFVHSIHFDSRQWQETFFFSEGSRLALENNLLPIHGILQCYALEVKRPEREADHSPPSISKVDNV